ncbi:hypothetical protein PHSY_003030 [Pseudozyma hubeiensis SY62]|uniref:Regulator of volume decrease after cellular swelling-domain-containing protein n=1 Tax=Pseudozyma hubeiensis (strain SY62) TaxID=1305764 RepID=R9P2H1_PSEHS|nr:hypothetical protein PHSY_003030 [Pseudozyma hubeiensis SY62]GAC95454.1 hypothetical protein PHSY_003030 [Pseudozyma hubeiensis SY62]
MEEISAPPAYTTAEQLAQLQTSTPQSFGDIAPLLHFHLAKATVFVSPSPSSRPSCFEALQATKAVLGDKEDDEENAEVLQASGQLWLTEKHISFLAPEADTGFQLAYPNVALHAVTRMPPSFLASSSTAAQNGISSSASLSTSAQDFHGCIYCQLDLSPNAGTGEMGVVDDDEGEFVEMYICTPGSVSLDQLFESLSHCASLHPTGPVEDDGGHPFSGFAPFGTSANGTQLGDGNEYDDGDGDDEGAFEDADGQADDQELSETGRVRADFQTPDSRYRPY